jgi:hypothetical protein
VNSEPGVGSSWWSDFVTNARRRFKQVLYWTRHILWYLVLSIPTLIKCSGNGIPWVPIAMRYSGGLHRGFHNAITMGSTGAIIAWPCMPPALDEGNCAHPHRLVATSPGTHMIKVYNREYRQAYPVDEQDGNKLADALTDLISAEEKVLVTSKSNVATQLIAQQSRDLREIQSQGLIHELRHVECRTCWWTSMANKGSASASRTSPTRASTPR